MDKKQYSWIVVANPPGGKSEVTLLQSETWYIDKLQAINSLKHLIQTRGIDIPDRWGSPKHFVIGRKKLPL